MPNVGPIANIARATLIAAPLIGSWLGMQAVHELGHAMATLATGGQVTRVVLSPWTISRTDFIDSRNPLLVVWAGPVSGVALPLALWLTLQRAPMAFLARFFAGFCSIANGCYLAFGSTARIGDAGELLRLGAPAWSLGMFGALAAPVGLWLWHGQGRCFGLGKSAEPVSWRSAGVAAGLCAALAILALAVGGE